MPKKHKCKRVELLPLEYASESWEQSIDAACREARDESVSWLVEDPRLCRHAVKKIRLISLMPAVSIPPST